MNSVLDVTHRLSDTQLRVKSNWTKGGIGSIDNYRKVQAACIGLANPNKQANKPAVANLILFFFHFVMVRQKYRHVKQQ